MGKLAGCD
jgi:hypothetical protein